MLTVKEIEAAKPQVKPCKLADGNSLYLWIMPTGGKLWRLKYRIGGKEKLLSLGVYPDVRPPEAREKAKAARDLIREGIDPSAKKKADKLASEVAGANTFEAVAREWLEGRKSHVEIGQHERTLTRMENDVFPWIGKRPIAEIDAPELLAVLRRIDGRGARYTAHRVRSEISRVFRFAIATGRAKSDPAQSLIGAIPPAVEKHMAAITDPAKVAEMLRAFDGFISRGRHSMRSHGYPLPERTDYFLVGSSLAPGVIGCLMKKNHPPQKCRRSLVKMASGHPIHLPKMQEVPPAKVQIMN